MTHENETVTLHKEKLRAMLYSAFMEGANAFKSGREHSDDDYKAWKESNTLAIILDNYKQTEED